MRKQPSSRMCFVCGESNLAGVRVRFYEQEDGSLLARFTGADYHQGYPGRMHGGVITAIMDETMGRAIMIARGETIWGVTSELTIRFRKPVPLGVELTATGRITAEKSRLFEGAGALYLPDGTVAVEGSGKYVKLDITRIGEWNPEREQWYVRPD
jgi:acyl-coenzyme A thioesterase PaaI-like protein